MVISFVFPRVTSLLLVVVISNIVPTAAQAKTPTAKSLLWEISGNGLKSSSYLFGTTHVGCATRLALTTEQKKSLSNVQQIYFEVNKGIDIDVSDPKIPEGKKLKDLTTQAQYQKIEDFFGRHVLEEKSLDSGLFSLAFRVGKINNTGRIQPNLCKDITSKESILKEAARKQEIPINGIETAADRKNIFSVKDGVDLLIGIISDDTPQELLDKSIIDGDILYHNQDINGLFIHDQKLSKKYPGTFETLLVTRNRLWLPRMIKIMSRKPTFFAFGVGHLTGETGLIPLLEEKGYTLRPIFDSIITPATSTIRDSSKIMELAEEYVRSGDAKSLEGNVLDAHDDYSKAIALNPQYAEAYSSRGNVRREVLRDPEGALSDFNTAISINPKDTNTYLYRGLLKSYMLKDYEGAVSDFSKIISPSYKAYRAYYERGLLRSDRLNDVRGALSDFDAAIYYSHRNQELYLARGILKYTKLNDKQAGINDVRQSIKLAQKSDDDLTIGKASAILNIMGASEK
jgi:uncharacterized protein